MRDRECGIDDLKFVDYKSLQRFRSLYFLKSQFTPSASSGDVPPKEMQISGVDKTSPRHRTIQTSQHSFKGLRHEKGQISPHVSRADIPPKEKITSRDDQKDPRDGTLQISKYSSRGPCHEKEKISSHVSSADIPPKEKKTSRDHQKDPRDGTFQTSQYSFKGPRHEKKQILSHVGRTDIPRKEKKTSRDDQKDLRNGTLHISQHSFKGLWHQKEQISFHVSTEGIAPKEKKTSRDDQKDPRNGTSRHTSKGPRHEKEISSHVSRADIPPKEKKASRDDQKDPQDGTLQTSRHTFKGPRHEELISSHASRVGTTPGENTILRADQTDLQVGGLETSQLSCSGTEHKPKIKSGYDVLEYSDSSILPKLERLSLRKHQFTFHARTEDLPPEERKDIWHIQIDRVDEELEISEGSRSRKECKPSAAMPRSSSGNGSEESSRNSKLPPLTGLCRQKDQVTSNASGKDHPANKRKHFADIHRDVRDGEVETSQYSAVRKKLKAHANVPTTGTCDLGLDFSNGSTSPRFKCLPFKKGMFLSHASSGGIAPKEKKTSRGDQTDTRDEKSESSKTIHFDDAPAGILDAETEASGPLSSNEQQAGLSIESHTTNHSTRRSYETDVGNAPAKIERPILKVSEHGDKTRDEDISFYESLIPYIKGLSPERKMLLQIKTQELIYNFVYKQKF
jgi:hypothetical protein